MDKKVIVSFVFSLLSLSLFGQEWKTIQIGDLGGSGFWLGSSSDAKQFKIDPSTNTIWSSWFDKIYELQSDGSLVLHNNQSDNTLPPSNAAFLEFAFTNNLVYTVDLYSGVSFNYDGVSWEIAAGTSNGKFVSAEDDTVWICQSPGNIVQLISGTPTLHTSGSRRIQSRNGHVWASQMSNGDSPSFLRYFEPGTFNWYAADTADFLLDNYQNDFKFMNNADTFFLSGNKGFSIALGTAFIDTLTPFNTTNMPASEVVEFEFDHNDNIWALFGSDLNNVSHIAFLDRSTNIWSNIFDTNNSPIDFSDYMSIEVDSDGNIYVMQRDQLHVFGDNGGPQWLNVETTDYNSQGWIHPNPSSGVLNLSDLNYSSSDNVEIFDSKGVSMLKTSYKNIITVELPEGMYFLQINGQKTYKLQIKNL